MVEEVLEATEGWSYDAVSIGYPGPVARNRPAKEPVNLGDGWVKFNYQRAFGVPVRIINDAAMQALGSYAGRTMLFLGLGTGLGNTLVINGIVVPLEMGHLPFANGKTYEDTIGEAGLKRTGKRKWRRNVKTIVELLAVGDQRRLRRAGRRQRALHGRAAPQHPARQQRERVPRRLPPLGRRATKTKRAKKSPR